MLLRRAQALTLYREILKLHKKYLPQDLRDIGDVSVAQLGGEFVL